MKSRQEVKSAEDRARRFEAGHSRARDLEQQLSSMDGALRDLKAREAQLLGEQKLWLEEREGLLAQVAEARAAGVAEFRASEEYEGALQARYKAGVQDTFVELEAKGALVDVWSEEEEVLAEKEGKKDIPAEENPPEIAPQGTCSEVPVAKLLVQPAGVTDPAPGTQPADEVQELN